MKKLTLLAIAVLSMNVAAEKMPSQSQINMFESAIIKKEDGLITSRLIVKFADKDVHKSLLQTPETTKLKMKKSKSRSFNEYDFNRKNGLQNKTDGRLGQSTLTDLAERYGLDIKHIRSSGLSRDVIEVTSNKEVDTVIEILKSSGKFSDIMANISLKTENQTTSNITTTWDSTEYNDPLYSDQVYFSTFEENKAGSDFATLKRNMENNLGRKLRVGIVDGGSHKHEDLVDVPEGIEGGYDFVTYISSDYSQERSDNHVGITYSKAIDENIATAHGVQVAASIAAISNNGIGLTGVLDSNDVEFIHAKVCHYGGCQTDSIMDGVLWLSGYEELVGVPTISEPVDIINVSLGGSSFVGCTELLQEVYDYAYERNIPVFVAAGNEDVDVSAVTPASCKNIVTVAALDPSTEDRSTFSNYGLGIDIAAAGSSIASVVIPKDATKDDINTEYTSISGTSFATPLSMSIAGAILMKYPELDLTPSQIERILENNSDKIKLNKDGLTSSCEIKNCGSGTVNANDSLMAIENILTVNTGKKEHVYKYEEDTHYISEMNTYMDACNLWKTSVGSVGTVLEGATYKIYTGNVGSNLTKENSTFVNEITDPIFVSSISEDDKIGYQVCLNGECNDELFEINSSDMQQPELCYGI